MANCITPHSIFKPSTKNIKFTKENIVAVEGASQLAHINLCDFTSPYQQFLTTFAYLIPSAKNVEIQYGALGKQITFLALYATYERKEPLKLKDTEIPYTEYYFETLTEEVRYFDRLMILSGNEVKMLPRIFLNNPSENYNVKIQIIAATSEITWENAIILNQSTNAYTVDGIYWTNILTDDGHKNFMVVDGSGNPVTFINYDKISNIELNGKIMFIDDTAVGKIQLNFVTEFDALQAYSLINWVLSDPNNNYITQGMLPDITAPVINYANTFDLNFDLTDYGTTSGTSFLNIITKDDIISKLISTVIDNRDGNVYIDGNNLKMTKVNSSIPVEAITKVGKYSLVIDVEDNAKNIRSDSFILNIKDSTLPKVILSTLGNTQYNLYNTLAGTSGDGVYLQDFALNTITKQDILDAFISSVTDIVDGDIVKIVNNIQVTIKNHYSNLALTEINTPGLYDIYFNVQNSMGNVSTNVWADTVTMLGTYLTVNIITNQAPDVVFNNIPEQFLLNYVGGTIYKSDMQQFISTVLDDRDGIITSNILNISLFQDAIAGTSGTSAFGYSSTSSTAFVELSYIPRQEVVYINAQGEYVMKVIVVDSNGSVSMEEKVFVVL